MNAERKVPTEKRPADSDPRLARNRRAYTYRPEKENQLWPVCIPESLPCRERLRPWWKLRFLPGWGGAYLNAGIKRLFFLLQRLTFRFDKVKAYGQLFNGSLPEYVDGADRDDHFAWRRIAGPNPLSLRQEVDLDALRRKIPFDVERVEHRLSRRLGRPISLAEEAGAGRLFACDFRLMQQALRPKEQSGHPPSHSLKGVKHLRDSRWRPKYLPAPIGVFLELPGFYERIDLVPLAIQIDQPQAVEQPVYYPDDEVRRDWGWKIAKLHFETADQVFHAGCGHVLRTHLTMNPFCMATLRQLPPDHAVHTLLQPHTRFTLATNDAAYKFYVNRKKAYAKFYSGKLEEYRRVSILSYQAKSFLELSLPAELESRCLNDAPKIYPYRDDARLWLRPIRDFVAEYLDAFYADNAAVRVDAPLQAWKNELVEVECGGVRGLVPEDCLDTKKKLVDLLAQVLFIAGPGHASQHFAEMYYYRYPPAFVGSAYAPPPQWEHEADKARWLRTLPPIGPATTQFVYSTLRKLPVRHLRALSALPARPARAGAAADPQPAGGVAGGRIDDLRARQGPSTPLRLPAPLARAEQHQHLRTGRCRRSGGGTGPAVDPVSARSSRRSRSLSCAGRSNRARPRGGASAPRAPACRGRRSFRTVTRSFASIDSTGGLPSIPVRTRSRSSAA